jgi:quercetin dioxygenase-like cupin family protein
METRNEIPAAEVLSLTDLVTIQSRAVVSRTLMDQKAGTLTLFAFDQEQGLSEHTAPFDAFVQVLAGEVEITIAGIPFRLMEGQAVLMPAHQPHALRAISPLKMLLFMVRS